MQKKLLPIIIFTVLFLSYHNAYASTPKWKVTNGQAVISNTLQWELKLGCHNYVTLGLFGKSNIGASSLVKGPMIFIIGGKKITASAIGHNKGAHIETRGIPDGDALVYTIIRKLVSGAKKVTIIYDSGETAKDERDKVLWKATYTLNGAKKAIKKVIRKCKGPNKHLKF